MKKLNMYFFGEEEVCLEDMMWLYGTNVLCYVIGIPAALIGFFG